MLFVRFKFSSPSFCFIIIIIIMSIIALSQNLFGAHDHVTYEEFLKFLKLHNLHNRGIDHDALLCISVYSGLKCWLPLLDITSIRVPPRNFRNSSPFPATRTHSPSARRISAANHMGKDVDIVSKPITPLKQNLRLTVTFLYQIVYVFSGFKVFAHVLLLCRIFSLSYCFVYLVFFVFLPFFIVFVFLCWSLIIDNCAVTKYLWNNNNNNNNNW